MPAPPSDNCSPTARSPVHPPTSINQFQHPFLIPQTDAAPPTPTTPSIGSVPSRLMRTLSARMRTTVSSHSLSNSFSSSALPSSPCPSPCTQPTFTQRDVTTGGARLLETDGHAPVGLQTTGLVDSAFLNIYNDCGMVADARPHLQQEPLMHHPHVRGEQAMVGPEGVGYPASCTCSTSMVNQRRVILHPQTFPCCVLPDQPCTNKHSPL